MSHDWLDLPRGYPKYLEIIHLSKLIFSQRKSQCSALNESKQHSFSEELYLCVAHPFQVNYQPLTIAYLNRTCHLRDPNYHLACWFFKLNVHDYLFIRDCKSRSYSSLLQHTSGLSFTTSVHSESSRWSLVNTIFIFIN